MMNWSLVTGNGILRVFLPETVVVFRKSSFASLRGVSESLANFSLHIFAETVCTIYIGATSSVTQSCIKQSPAIQPLTQKLPLTL